MNVFISGGCKNGKSYYAQRLTKEMSESENKPLYYIATMKPVDEEDRARIKRHIEEREGWGFITIEQPCNILEILNGEYCQGAFLLDSVTALLSNEMFRQDGTIDFDAPKRLAKELTEFAKATGNTVFVSDFIYADGKNYDNLTEEYRKGLAYIDKILAAHCDKVYEVTYSSIINYHK